MSDIRNELFALSQRIEDAEKKFARAGAHIARRKQAGENTIRAEQLLAVMLVNLRLCYERRGNLRRKMWTTRNRSDDIALKCSVPSASLQMADADLTSFPRGEAARACLPPGTPIFLATTGSRSVLSTGVTLTRLHQLMELPKTGLLVAL